MDKTGKAKDKGKCVDKSGVKEAETSRADPQSTLSLEARRAARRRWNIFSAELAVAEGRLP